MWRLCALLLLVVLSGCSAATSAALPAQAPTPSKNDTVTVFAASSLKDAFGKMAGQLNEAGISPTYNFAGSQDLVSQMSLGARADVFASADLKNMQSAISAGVVATGTQHVMATNELVVIVAPGKQPAVNSLQALAKPGVKIDLADPSVPVGNYSLQALDKLSAGPAYGKDFKEKVLANIVSHETNVRQVLAKVQLGQADAGIVYTTDAKTTSSGNAVGTISIPAQYNVVARYYIAPIKGAPHPDAADRFTRYVLSPDGQKILASYGFGSAGEK